MGSPPSLALPLFFWRPEEHALSPVASLPSSLLPSSPLLGMDFLDLVLNLIGKGGSILLVPSGVLILCQIHGSYSSRLMIFVFGLTSFDARDFGGFPSSL